MLSRNGPSLAVPFEVKFEVKYNIVSFDPGGVGDTLPRISCLQEQIEELYVDAVTVSNSLPGQHSYRVLQHEVGTIIVQAQLLSDLCQKSPDSELHKSLGTPAVARDITLIHTALGDPKLHYWGLSYGTVLGSTYADMFPDNVGRVVLNCAMDAPKNYYVGEWSHNFKNTEEELDKFFDECVTARPVDWPSCPPRLPN